MKEDIIPAVYNKRHEERGTPSRYKLDVQGDLN